jgi:hypothetical protein
VGIDYRPATGQLYGLGINATLNTGTLYLIDAQAGTATAVGTPTQIAFTTDGVTAVDFPAATSGWGFDFNPSVDRIRVTTGTGLNFRVNPITGAPVDGNNGGAVTNGTNPDGAISGAGTGLEDVAYTDGPAATGAITTEYGLNVANQALHIVTVPNTGTLGTAIPIKVGGNALAFTAIGGFDIPQSVKTPAANAAVTEGSGYAVLTVAGTTGLYKINLVDGTATLLGSVGAGTTGLGGLAVGH